MKPTQEQVIAWAREAGFSQGVQGTWNCIFVQMKKAFTLAYEAGQESMKWDGIHSCHQDCQRPACVHTRKTYQEGYEAGRKDENEACAKVSENGCFLHDDSPEARFGKACANAIRARREQ